MKSVSRIALGIALVVGSASMVATAPADAQKKKKGEAAQAQAPKLSKEERAALAPLQAAVTAKDWPAATAALSSAEAAMQSADAKFYLEQFRFDIGRGSSNVAMQSQALDALLASGKVPADMVTSYTRAQAVLANNAGNRAKAEASFAKVLEASPNDIPTLVDLAQIKRDLKKPEEAVQLMSRAIEIKRAAGEKVDEAWYKFALNIALQGRQNPALRDASQKLSRDLIAAYPSKENWRDLVLIFRDTNNLDGATELDVLRFQRASDAMGGERDWYLLADGLYKAGNYAETKSVLDDGVAKKMIDPKKPAYADLIRLTNARMAGDRASLGGEESKAMAAATGTNAVKVGDAYFGYGENAKAIALYRAALTKSGVDANLVNTRLAMALLASGDRAGAEAAFKSLTGPRQNLGAYWLAWLSRGAA